MPRANLCLVLACSALGSWAATGAEEEPVCRAGEACSGEQGYYWPNAHGNPKHYATSPYVGPFNLTSSLAWTWHHPNGRYNDMLLGVSIDDKKNSYVATDRGVWKLDPEGKALWNFDVPPMAFSQLAENLVPNGASLADGRLFFDVTDGRFFALDMETGKELWMSRPAINTCCDTGVVAVNSGVVIAETDQSEPCGRCLHLRGLSAVNGTELWAFTPDNPVWDLMVQFAGDGTFVFQDITGRVYRNWLSNGTNIWKSGGYPNSWTDGTQMLGPNGIIYAVNLNSCAGPDCHGSLSAYSFKDGQPLWKQPVPRPPNSSPVVGRLREGAKLSVVIPVGQQPSCYSPASHLWWRFPSVGRLPQSVQTALFVFFHRLSDWLGDSEALLWNTQALPTDVYAFSADTGDFEWKWTGPTYKRFMCPGDMSGYLNRKGLGIRAASCPTPWSAPRIGGDGTIYLGNQNGHFYAIRDHNGDGKIDPETEVSDFDCEAEFTSIGSAHAPGMVVIASSDRVFAFKS